MLINGAGGGSGSFAIQLAKLWGCHVTGVDSAEKFETMRALGAEHVIDYKKEDFTQNEEQYDVILDLVATHSISDYNNSLTPTGSYLMVGGTMSNLFSTLVTGSWYSKKGGKQLGMLSVEENASNSIILDLIESGDLSIVIDKTYSFEEVPEALKYHGEGHAKGKVVVVITGEEEDVE